MNAIKKHFNFITLFHGTHETYSFKCLGITPFNCMKKWRYNPRILNIKSKEV